MNIVRDNVQIELTDAEIEAAYRERQKYYHKLDLEGKIKEYCDNNRFDFSIDDEKEYEIGKTVVKGKDLKNLINDSEWMDSLTEDFDSLLDGYDSYWECYWTAAENAIEEAIKEKFKS